MPLIILYRFNKWYIGRLARAERITLYRCSFIDAVADAGTESEGLFLGGKCFGFGEIECVVLGEIGFESVEVVVYGVRSAERKVRISSSVKLTDLPSTA